MTPGGKPGGFEHLVRVVRAEHRARGRLPDDGVAHQRGRGRQVAADGREVERRDGIDEPFERPVLHRVPHARAADGLFLVELLREGRVEAPEIDHLARRVDLRLVHRLRLSQHRRGVNRRAPRGGEQLGGAQDDGGAILPRPRRPFASCGCGRRNRLLDVFGSRNVVLGEHVTVIVRHHGLLGSSRADLPTADDDRDVDLLCGHRREACLELRALGRAGRVRLHRFVDSRRHTPDARECRVELDRRTRCGGRGGFLCRGSRSRCGHGAYRHSWRCGLGIRCAGSGMRCGSLHSGSQSASRVPHSAFRIPASASA